jgi:methylated-DNA-[protein]-cysteine S-methyltransferase
MERTRYTVFETAWGYAGFSAGPKGIVKLGLPQQERCKVAAQFDGAIFDAGLMKGVQKSLKRYFEGEGVDFRTWPLVDLGPMTAFGEAVLLECRKLRFGEKATYGELARRAGNPRAARAVGTILAQNSIPLIVPCHRILRADGQAGGFSGPGGIRMKKRLLEMESAGARGF